MAPEQTEGDNVDNRSDIFAIGIVLHEVLTGRRLFKGQNDVADHRARAPLRGAAAVGAEPGRAARARPDHPQGAAARSGAALEQRRRHGGRAGRHRARARASSRRTCSRSSTTCSRSRAARRRRARAASAPRRGRSAGSPSAHTRSRTVPPVSRTRLGRAAAAGLDRWAAGPRRSSPSRSFRRRLVALLALAGAASAAGSTSATHSARDARVTIDRRSGPQVPRLREVGARRRGHLPGRGQAADRRDAGDAADRSDGRRVGEADRSRRPATRTTNRSSSTTRRSRST